MGSTTAEVDQTVLYVLIPSLDLASPGQFSNNLASKPGNGTSPSVQSHTALVCVLSSLEQTI